MSFEARMQLALFIISISTFSCGFIIFLIYSKKHPHPQTKKTLKTPLLMPEKQSFDKIEILEDEDINAFFDRVLN